MIPLVLPSSIADLLKEVLSPLNREYSTYLILMRERDDVLVAYAVWFKDRFWDFIPPFF